MPLVIAPIGKTLQVTKIAVDDKTKKHFESLGLIVGCQLCVLSNNKGSLICLIKDYRLALDKYVASKIYVI